MNTPSTDTTTTAVDSPATGVTTDTHVTDTTETAPVVDTAPIVDTTPVVDTTAAPVDTTDAPVDTVATTTTAAPGESLFAKVEHSLEEGFGKVGAFVEEAVEKVEGLFGVTNTETTEEGTTAAPAIDEADTNVSSIVGGEDSGTETAAQ